MTHHILIVEDDSDITALVSRYLKANDCRVSVASDGHEMDRLMSTSRVDLVVLDIMLPGGEDGLSICRRLRSTSTLPIIIVSARGDEVDRVIGLEVGADDYLAKPFSARELLARIRAILRRSSTTTAPSAGTFDQLEFDGWCLHARARNLTSPSGAKVTLTGAEFDLLMTFAERPGLTLSRDQLLDITQGRIAAPFERSIDILVSRLRRKLSTEETRSDYIRTIRSEGYLFTPEVRRI